MGTTPLLGVTTVWHIALIGNKEVNVVSLWADSEWIYGNLEGSDGCIVFRSSFWGAHPKV